MEEEHIQTYYLVNSGPLWSGTAMNFWCNCLPESLFHFHCNCLRRPLSPQISTHLSWISESEGFFMSRCKHCWSIVHFFHDYTKISVPDHSFKSSSWHEWIFPNLLWAQGSYYQGTSLNNGTHPLLHCQMFLLYGSTPISKQSCCNIFSLQLWILTVSLWCILPCES